MQGIEKSFDQNHVLKKVDFELKPGEIRALMGENGAGKTTFMNILGGVFPPNAGKILLDGREVRFHTPRESQDAGIAFIHQELNLVNDLSIYENLFLGRELKKGRFLDKKAMIERAREVLGRMEIDMDPRTLVGALDASYKQIIEIARALLMNASIIIMDEPTTSLTEVEIERVFGMMRTVKSQGVSIVFISHKLKEVMAICDTITVLRDGSVVYDGDIASVTEADIAYHMVGHTVRTEQLKRDVRIGDEALAAEGLSCEGLFSDISFSIRSGEIVGFTGLLGDGRSELFQTVFGCYPQYAGTIRVGGKVMRMNGTPAAYRAGIGYVPRNRKENGIIKDMSILENGSMATYDRLTRMGLIDHRKERAAMEKNRADLSIKMGEMDDLITSLSGGNQQKVVLAKW
ncbi:MAG: sugar ABC transporter ATP-binding protein, partial [Clostridia bacterium]|nr:sugar ABC transporter ATP-binding protein [Clostridia bacterium]